MAAKVNIGEQSWPIAPRCAGFQVFRIARSDVRGEHGDSIVVAVQFDERGRLRLDLGADDLPPKPLPHRQRGACLRGESLCLSKVRGQRQQHADGQIAAVASDKHSAGGGQPRKDRLGKGDLRVRRDDNRQIR